MVRTLFSNKALLIFSVLLFSIVALPSCKKVAEKLFSGFDLPLTDIPTVIPTISVSYYTFLTSTTIKFNLDSIVKAESRGSFGGGDLTSVKVKQATLRLQQADAPNMALLQTVSIQLYSDSVRIPVTLVSANVPDSASTTLHFDASQSPEILPYLQGKTITYIVTVVNRRPITQRFIAYTDMTIAIK
jgi:hypothetical protein